MDYKKMKKSELLKICKEKGVEVLNQDKKPCLILKLEQAQDVPKSVTPEAVITKQAEQSKELAPQVENFIVMDNADDSLILREMQGEVIKTYVYSFPQGGKEVVGLSKAGVDASCREAADKKGEAYRVIGDPIINEDDEYIKVVIKAGRYRLIKSGNEIKEVLIDTALGSKRQWKKMKLRGGKIEHDQFAFEKAVSKAERNAKMRLLPYPFIIEMVKMFKGGGMVQELNVQQVISEEQRRLLYTKGLGEVELKRIIGEYGFASTTDITADLFPEILAKLEAKEKERELPPIPEKIKTGWGILATPEAKQKLIWGKYIDLHKEKAEEVLLHEINNEANRRGDEKK